MKAFRVFILGLTVFLLYGCGEAPEALLASEADSVSEITEPMTGAQLRVEVMETEVDLTGLVSLRVTLLWGEDVTVELINPDWLGAGWAYATERAGEIRFDGTVYSQLIEYELEPFLDGAYEVPSIGIRAESEAVGRRIARLSPVEVIVASVLEEGDGRDLDPAVGLAEMVASEDGVDMNWGVWGGLGVAFVSGVVVVWLRMRSSGNGIESIDPKAVLAIAASSKTLSEEDLGTLHRALVALSDEHGQLRLISHEIERERFSGSAVDHKRVQSAAQRAVEVCGVKL